MTVTWSSPELSEPLLDVEVEDTQRKDDKKATATVLDQDGSASYPKGTEVTLDVSDATVSNLTRFRGWVSGTDRRDGRLALDLNSFDTLLFNTFTHSFENASLDTILWTLITEYTPIGWTPAAVNIPNNRTLTRDWRGVSLNQAIGEIAALAGGAQWGVRESANFLLQPITFPLNRNIFYFEPEGDGDAPRDFTDTDWIDYRFLQNHKTEANKAIVYYGQGENRRRVVANDTNSQATLGSNMGLAGGVETTVSKYYPQLTNQSFARDIAEALLEQHPTRETIELTTWAGFDVYPGQTARVVIPEHNIDEERTVSYCRYRYRDDETVIRFS